jgi:hypothetical protein
MKRLFWLVLFAAVGWYGWQHRATLLHPEVVDEVVIVNATGTDIVRVRVTVDGQTLVREAIANGTSSTLTFHLERQSEFQVEWQWRRREGRVNWRGGLVTPGPVPLRTTITALTDGTAMATSEPVPPRSPGR